MRMRDKPWEQEAKISSHKLTAVNLDKELGGSEGGKHCAITFSLGDLLEKPKKDRVWKSNCFFPEHDVDKKNNADEIPFTVSAPEIDETINVKWHWTDADPHEPKVNAVESGVWKLFLEKLGASVDDTIHFCGDFHKDARVYLEKTSLSDLSDELFFGYDFEYDFFSEVAELLDDRSQAIFYGPPGTGKTWAALKLAKVLATNNSCTEFVQFHPSYAYEDFIEGWRPTEGGGFEKKDGPLKRMATKAAKPENRNKKYVLVIDEINRANLSKVLGELFFLLEYRDRSIRLQYSDDSDDKFELPENLKIIGTMNTTDRSIALVDMALRRRFHFHGFFPDKEPIQGLLKRWLVANKKEGFLWVADLVDAANSKLLERDLTIGPSHFMKDDLDEEMVQRIWKRSIMPYIEDHYFDNPDRATEFSYDQLRNDTKP